MTLEYIDGLPATRYRRYRNHHIDHLEYQQEAIKTAEDEREEVVNDG